LQLTEFAIIFICLVWQQSCTHPSLLSDGCFCIGFYLKVQAFWAICSVRWRANGGTATRRLDINRPQQSMALVFRVCEVCTVFNL